MRSYLSAVTVGHRKKWFFRIVKVVHLTYRASENPWAYFFLCSLDLILAAFLRRMCLVPESATAVGCGLKFIPGSVDLQAKLCSLCRMCCDSQLWLSTRKWPRNYGTECWGWWQIASPMLKTTTSTCRDNEAVVARRLQSCFLKFFWNDGCFVWIFKKLWKLNTAGSKSP